MKANKALKDKKAPTQALSDTYCEGNRVNYCVELFAEKLSDEILYKMSELQALIKSDSMIIKALIYNIIIPFDALLDRYYLNDFLKKENISRETI